MHEAEGHAQIIAVYEKVPALSIEAVAVAAVKIFVKVLDLHNLLLFEASEVDPLFNEPDPVLLDNVRVPFIVPQHLVALRDINCDLLGIYQDIPDDDTVAVHVDVN